MQEHAIGDEAVDACVKEATRKPDKVRVRVRVRVRLRVRVKLTRRTARVLDLADVHGLLAALDHAGVVGRVAVESDLHAERNLPWLRQALRRVVPEVVHLVSVRVRVRVRVEVGLRVRVRVRVVREVVHLHLVRARWGDHARLGYGQGWG